MKACVAALCILLGLASPASADGWHLAAKVAITAAGVTQATDLSTSMYLMGKGGFKEGNPLMRPFSKDPVLMGTAKGGFGTGITLWLSKMQKEHPKRALLIATTMASITGAVTVHNYRKVKR